MKFINKYLRNLSPYRVASHKIWEVNAVDRNKILKLDWNEATISPTPLVQKALMKLTDSPDIFSLYPSTYNNQLHELLAAYCELPKEYIQYFASSDALHEYLVRMYVSVGDPVLILGPTYDNFRLTCESQGAKIHFFELDKDFTFNEHDFEAAINSIRPSLIYICNPNNPTGGVLDIDYIEKLLNAFSDSIFLIDEAYFEFCGLTTKGLITKNDNLFISRTFSKAFALANFRAGYLLSSKENVEQISKIRNAKNFTSFTQEAVVAALSDIPYMKRYVAEVTSAREHFIKFLETFQSLITIYPSSGNFILVQFSTRENKMMMLKRLEDNNIYVRDLTHSQLLLNCLRITIGTIDQMKRVEAVIEEYFSKKR
jgi:histidinol-phosphate aminotransferase